MRDPPPINTVLCVVAEQNTCYRGEKAGEARVPPDIGKQGTWGVSPGGDMRAEA